MEKVSVLGKGRGFVICCEVPAYLPAKPTGLFFPKADLRPRHTLHCWKGQREGSSHAQGEVLAAAKSIHCFCITGMKIELNAAYLKSEREG